MRRALGVLSVVAGLSAVGFSQIRQQHLDDQQQADRRHEEAILCVRSWAAREDIRDMAEKVYRRNAETLLSLATEETPNVIRYRELIEGDVLEIRATLADPECDLEAAEQRLEES
jgi:hypothetical protein